MHMSTRRQFLKNVAIGAGGVAILGASLTQRPVRLFYRLTRPVISHDTPTGPLSTHSLQTLLSVTEALLGPHIEKSHYADFFRWYAENVRGYKVFYVRFTEILDQLGKQSGTCDFVDCDATAKNRILEKIFPFDRTLGRIWATIFERELLRVERYFKKPVLELFAKTDAWILLGYTSWPGMPRGLDKYTQAPLNAESGGPQP